MPIETSDDRGFEWCDVCGELLYTKPGPHRCPGAPDRVESPKAARRLSQVVLEPGYERQDNDLQCWEDAQNLAHEVERLRACIDKAIAAANGRWEEWGCRAEMVRDALDAALEGIEVE